VVCLVTVVVTRLKGDACISDARTREETVRNVARVSRVVSITESRREHLPRTSLLSRRDLDTEVPGDCSTRATIEGGKARLIKEHKDPLSNLCCFFCKRPLPAIIVPLSLLFVVFVNELALVISAGTRFPLTRVPMRITRGEETGSSGSSFKPTLAIALRRDRTKFH